jgi:hypothetical protein
VNNTLTNKAIIKKVAVALGELNEKVIYVGGATIGLYINDPAAEDVRLYYDTSEQRFQRIMQKIEHVLANV